jgi:hypothetical protein
LGTLLLNDHVFKRFVEAGTLSAMVTGKLSDVAGLVVAPTLLAAIAQRVIASPWVPRVAFICVVAFFCALKLSVSTAAAWSMLWGSIGVAQRTLADPSDLIALPVAYFAYRRMVARTEAHVDWNAQLPFGSSVIHRAAVVLGGIGCLATSFDWDQAPISPAVRNATVTTIGVGIQYYARALECDEPLEDTAWSVTHVEELEPGEWVTLAASETDGGTEDLPCGAAAIGAAGMRPIVVRWDLRQVERLGSAESKERVANGTVYLEQFGSEVRPSLGQGVTAVEPQL